MNIVLQLLLATATFSLSNICDLDDNPEACDVRLRGDGIEPRGEWSCQSTEDGPVCERPGKCYSGDELPDNWVPFCLVEVCGPVDGRTECWQQVA